MSVKSQWQNADMNILATLDLIYSAAASIITASVEAQSDGHMHTNPPPHDSVRDQRTSSCPTVLYRQHACRLCTVHLFMCEHPAVTTLTGML